MVSTKKAYNLLVESLSDLEERNGQLSPDDYAADIINVTCQYLIDNNYCYRNGVNAMDYFYENYINLRNDVESIISSISGVYPNIVTDQTVESMAQNVCLNIGWVGMPTFLKDYFYKKHGKTGNVASEFYEFSSSSHIRYENGRAVSKSNVDRQISLTFSNDRQHLLVTITPSLSPKEANLKSQLDSRLIYKGIDPEYKFEVVFDEFDDVCGFSVELIDRKIKLEYFE